MKLVYLSSARLPTKNAHGFQIMNMCASFVNAGTEVELVVPRRKNLIDSDPFAFYALPQIFRVKALPAIDLYHIRIIPEKISGIILLFTFFISARLYLWLHPCDVLFTRETFAGLFFKKFVFEVHMPEQVVRHALRADKLVVLTSAAKDELLKVGVSSQKILVAPDAVNLSLFPKKTKEEARKYLNLPLDARIALYWGNFKVWKGVDTLAGAVTFLPEVLVVMIGATKDTDLARIKEVVGVASNVIVEGFKPQEMLPWYLASADALVLPNTANDENSRLYTSPMKLFEYMASDRPIVASDLPSLREILSEENSVLVEPDNPRLLAEGIRQLLDSSELAKRLSTQASQQVLNYSWDKRAQAIIDFVLDKSKV